MRYVRSLPATAILLVIANVVVAGDSPCQPIHGKEGQEVVCPHCHYRCKFERVPDKEEKHCWEIERKQICIPRVTFPWESCCKPVCAKVKHVRVLKKVEYECERCKCKFTPEPVCCPSCHHGECAASSP